MLVWNQYTSLGHWFQLGLGWANAIYLLILFDDLVVRYLLWIEALMWVGPKVDLITKSPNKYNLGEFSFFMTLIHNLITIKIALTKLESFKNPILSKHPRLQIRHEKLQKEKSGLRFKPKTRSSIESYFLARGRQKKHTAIYQKWREKTQFQPFGFFKKSNVW